MPTFGKHLSTERRRPKESRKADTSTTSMCGPSLAIFGSYRVVNYLPVLLRTDAVSARRIRCTISNDSVTYDGSR